MTLQAYPPSRRCCSITNSTFRIIKVRLETSGAREETCDYGCWLLNPFESGRLLVATSSRPHWSDFCTTSLATRESRHLQNRSSVHFQKDAYAIQPPGAWKRTYVESAKCEEAQRAPTPWVSRHTMVSGSITADIHWTLQRWDHGDRGPCRRP